MQTVDMQINESISADEISYQGMLDDVGGMASPPDVCVRLFELLHSQHSSAQQIAEIIAIDPNLTVRLLRMANSAFYQFRAQIDTVSRAIAVIGNSELYNLVLSISAVKTFNNIPNELVSMETFWRHSVYVGLLSRGFAKKANVLHPERLFVAGLLHDIGSMVLYHYQPEKMRELLIIANNDEEKLYQAEKKSLGYTHASLAGGLLAEWQLPDELQQAVAWHHEPEFASIARSEACIISLSSRLANQMQAGHFPGAEALPSEFSGELCQELGFTDTEINGVMEQASEQFSSTLQSLL